MNKQEEYIILLEGLIIICEANKGLLVKNENWILDAEGLALKFLRILHLRCTSIKEQNLKK